MTTPRSDGSRFARDLALLLGVPFVLLVALLSWWKPWVPKVYLAASENEVVKLVAGTWDYKGTAVWCRDYPETITFSPDHKVMTIAGRRREKHGSNGDSNFVVTYDIEQVTRSTLHAMIHGEHRKTKTGELLTWDLILTGRDSFAWHRRDWGARSRSKERLRCTSGTPQVDTGNSVRISIPGVTDR